MCSSQNAPAVLWPSSQRDPGALLLEEGPHLNSISHSGHRHLLNDFQKNVAYRKDKESTLFLSVKNSGQIRVLFSAIFSFQKSNPYCDNIELAPDFYTWVTPSIVHNSSAR